MLIFVNAYLWASTTRLTQGHHDVVRVKLSGIIYYPTALSQLHFSVFTDWQSHSHTYSIKSAHIIAHNKNQLHGLLPRNQHYADV